MINFENPETLSEFLTRYISPLTKMTQIKEGSLKKIGIHCGLYHNRTIYSLAKNIIFDPTNLNRNGEIKDRQKYSNSLNILIPEENIIVNGKKTTIYEVDGGRLSRFLLSSCEPLREWYKRVVVDSPKLLLWQPGEVDIYSIPKKGLQCNVF